MTALNPIAVWDFTIPEESLGREEITKWCRDKCKHWCFQLEEGTNSGYRHWQGRVSLRTKARTMIKQLVPAHWSITHDSGTQLYVTKEETRVEGPWSDKAEEAYIPLHIRDKSPLPWQQMILDSAGMVERKINVIVDEKGCHGKSILCAMARTRRYLTIPPVGDAKELISTCCDILSARRIREPGLIIIDIPRAVNKNRLGALFTAIETIKQGWVYDMRYQYKEWVFDPPSLWIMSNHNIPKEFMSADTWVLWKFIEDKLVNFTQLAKELALGTPEDSTNEASGGFVPESPSATGLRPLAQAEAQLRAFL